MTMKDYEKDKRDYEEGDGQIKGPIEETLGIDLPGKLHNPILLCIMMTILFGIPILVYFLGGKNLVVSISTAVALFFVVVISTAIERANKIKLDLRKLSYLTWGLVIVVGSFGAYLSQTLKMPHSQKISIGFTVGIITLIFYISGLKKKKIKKMNNMNK